MNTELRFLAVITAIELIAVTAGFIIGLNYGVAMSMSDGPHAACRQIVVSILDCGRSRTPGAR